MDENIYNKLIEALKIINNVNSSKEYRDKAQNVKLKLKAL
jgi:hypothetical protein